MRGGALQEQRWPREAGGVQHGTGGQAGGVHTHFSCCLASTAFKKSAIILPGCDVC